MKGLKYLAGVAALATGLSGCGDQKVIDPQQRSIEYNMAEANGYDVGVMYRKSGSSYQINIGNTDSSGSHFDEFIHASDIDGDQKVDEISLRYVSPNSPLRGMASADRIDSILGAYYDKNLESKIESSNK